MPKGEEGTVNMHPFRVVLLLIITITLSSSLSIASNQPTVSSLIIHFPLDFEKIAFKLIVIIFILLMSIVVILALRSIGSFPSEFDRLGSDLNLYGYGITLTFFFGIVLKKNILTWLSWMDFQFRLILVVFTIFLTFILYGINMCLSESIRKLDDEHIYLMGLEDLSQWKEVYNHPKGKRLLLISFF